MREADVGSCRSACTGVEPSCQANRPGDARTIEPLQSSDSEFLKRLLWEGRTYEDRQSSDVIVVPSCSRDASWAAGMLERRRPRWIDPAHQHANLHGNDRDDYPHRHSDADRDQHPIRNTDEHAVSDGDPDGHADCHPNGNGDGNAHKHRDEYPHRHSDADRDQHPNRNTDEHAVSDGDRKRHAHGYPYGHAHGVPYSSERTTDG